MVSKVSIEELQRQGENAKLYSEIERLRLRLALLRQEVIAPMDALEDEDRQDAVTAACDIVRGELDEVACATSVNDLTGPHGFLSKVAQVAAVAIKSVISYLWYREAQK